MSHQMMNELGIKKGRWNFPKGYPSEVVSVECSTFLTLWASRVAKASLGPIPPPFLITFQILNELGTK